MNPGKKFEQSFANSVPKDIYFMRIKDSANNFTRSSRSSFATSNPFDCFMLYEGYFMPMELKSTKSTSFSIQSKNKEDGKDIKYHQIVSLQRAQTFKNVIAGFVLDFRESNTYWISIDDFTKFLSSTTKKSINEKDVVEHNGIIVSKTIMRVNYKYDISELLKNITERF